MLSQQISKWLATELMSQLEIEVATYISTWEGTIRSRQQLLETSRNLKEKLRPRKTEVHNIKRSRHGIEVTTRNTAQAERTKS